jgi:glycosyltransferase involved in cell wall biosynthesis
MDVPVVYTPHAMMTLKPGLPYIVRHAARAYERLFARWTGALVAVSSAEFQHALGIGISPSRLRTVHNGILPAATAAPSRSPGAPTTIGFVGRLCRQKNLPLLLRAFSMVVRSPAASMRLVLVGDGPEKASLRELAQRLGLASEVEWWGECDGRSAIGCFDILALPSDYEGFPYVLLEAMALGVPVVTTEVGGSEELVRSTSSGIIVPVGDLDGFSSALSSLVQSPALRQKLGSAGRAAVASFSVEQMSLDLLEIYASLAIQASCNEHAVNSVQPT